MVAYANQRPSSKFVPQSIIDTIPNTNKIFTLSSAILKSISKVLLVPFQNINNNLRCPSAHPQTLSSKSISGTIPNTNKTYAIQRPSWNPIPKVLLVHSKYQ